MGARGIRAAAAAGASGILVAVALLAAGWWLVAERAATARAVGDDLGEAEGAFDRLAWPEARTAFERAKARLGDGGPAELRGRLDRTGLDLDLADRLEAIHTAYVDSGGMGTGTDFDPDGAGRAYAAAFEGAGLGAVRSRPRRSRNASGRRASAGPSWRRSTTGRLARSTPAGSNGSSRSPAGADPDPESGWRDRVRDPATARAAAALAELARTAPLDGRSVPLHLYLAKRLLAVGGDGLGFHRRVQAAHPDDFWATFTLACEWRRTDADAISYYRAALASARGRWPPSSTSAMPWKTRAGSPRRRSSGGTPSCCTPKATPPHYNLALSHRGSGRYGEAADHCRRAIRLDPRHGPAYVTLGRALLERGEFGEARQAARHGLELVPAGQEMWIIADLIVRRCDRLQPLEARLAGIAGGTDLPAGPDEAIDFAELCDRKGRLAAAVRLYAAAFAAPEKFQESWGGRRYKAACDAARAGLGEGEDAPLDGPGRAALRRQALAWLRAERASWVAAATAGDADGRRAAARTFRTWQGDAALAGVREPDALAWLGDVERHQWQAWWTSLDILAAGGAFPTLTAAQSHAARRGWKSAAEGYARLIEWVPADPQAWFEFAAVQLLSGDRDGYRRTCARLLAGGPGSPAVRPYHVARACTLAPDAADDPAKPAEAGKDELAKYASTSWSLTEQGALLHRAGRSSEAVGPLEKSLAADAKAGKQVLNWLWLALAQHRLGKADEARRWLDKAVALLDSAGGPMPADAVAAGMDLHNWLEACVLRREAEALLRSPAAPK